MSLLSIHPVVEVSRDSTMTTRVAAPIYDPLLSPGLWEWLCWQTEERKMWTRSLAQTQVSSIAAGQRDCLHQQTSRQQLR